jgi:hypothetical protein
MFEQAIRFHQAQEILKSSPNDQREALVQPVCVLAAFTIELLLKCLIRIEGGRPPSIHELNDLFNLLSAPTRERLVAMWRDYVHAMPAETTEPFKRIGVTTAGRKAFQRIRYWHEEAGDDFVFYFGDLPTMLFTVAFELRSDWGEPC